MNWILSWALFFTALAGCAVTFATAVAGMSLAALIAGAVTLACGFVLFVDAVS